VLERKVLWRLYKSNIKQLQPIEDDMTFTWTWINKNSD